MKKKNVGNILQELIEGESRKDQNIGDHFLTSFGVPLVRVKQHHYKIDLSDLRVFAGLSTFVSLLTNDVMEQCSFGIADIMVRKRLDPQIMKELTDMGILWVTVYARLEAAESLPFFQRRFHQFLNTVFNAIQTPRWGGILFPEYFDRKNNPDEEAVPALVFPFNLLRKEDKADYYILAERSQTGHFLRITVEDANESRLQLKHISHRVVDNLDSSFHIAQRNTIAQQIHQGILRECMNSGTEYKESPDRQFTLFEHLKKEGLPDLSLIHFRWPSSDFRFFLPVKTAEPLSSINDAVSILNKIMLCLGDRDVLNHLARKDLIEMRAGDRDIFFDISRRGACLNICFDAKRPRPVLHNYLNSMPRLEEEISREGSMKLKGVRLFLIHHITSEVLGLIEAYRSLGCEAVTTLFVKYAGVVPDDYLEALFTMPDDRFRFYSLQKIELRDSLQGAYSLSNQYSDSTGLAAIDDYLLTEKPDFFTAMRFVAGHLFFREAVLHRNDERPLLLVEDGGYLAPLINRFCLENKTVGDVLNYFRVTAAPSADKIDLADEEMRLPLATWMARFFIGSVEHTKNGHEYIEEVMQQFGRLQFPAGSIAVSHLKRGPEALACSAAILNAVENILHRTGLLLSNRRALVLGSSGAIGQYLVNDLCDRLCPDRVCGVDIAPPRLHKHAITAVRSLDELEPEILYEIDLVIGVIGKSILQPLILEDIIDRGRQSDLFFASGSTKTLEFADLERWLQNLKNASEPQIAGKAVSIHTTALRDLQTGILQGHRVSIRFADGSLPEKNLYLLGGLTPINFLYYGIPREMMEQVMAQLVGVCVGVVQHHNDGRPLPPRLLAVDHEIDRDANLLP
ncbi:MAG: hypothetical protein JW943_06600 [Deltaproteobacteria bacterium]|nr:hypothetical protein [Deltaproteobacteria bacterium]